jgi:hypothetical protein
VDSCERSADSVIGAAGAVSLAQQANVAQRATQCMTQANMKCDPECGAVGIMRYAFCICMRRCMQMHMYTTC